ncbi:MAG: hypothetical protein ACKOXC_03480 [Aquirufa sp.]
MYNHLFAPAIGRKLGIVLIVLLIGVSRGYAQEWTFQAGINVTTFSFQNSSGQALKGIKPGSGNSLGIQYQRNWVDTSALLLKSNPAAIYINQHPIIAKLLSRFQWGVGIHLNQYNAVGDAVNTAYSYQTNYVGISPSLGYKQKVYKGLSFQGSGILQVNGLLQGNQWVNNQFVELKNDPQFNGIQSLTGFQIGLSQKITESFQISLQYGQLLNTAPIASQGTTLSMQPMHLLFGIIIQPKSK